MPFIKDRVLTFENLSPILGPFVLSNIQTVQDLKDSIPYVCPNLNLEVIDVRFSNTHSGSIGRKWFVDTIPDDTIYIYAHCYLKKHPSINVKLNKHFSSK